MATLLADPAGADQGPTLKARVGGGVQRRERSHLGALGEKSIRDGHDGPVEPGRPGRLEVRRRVARMRREALDTPSVTTRASSPPSIPPIRSPASPTCPRWLVPNWSSKPSAVSLRGGAITPAL